jgi:Leucine-rich repeat (LRR) protein
MHHAIYISSVVLFYHATAYTRWSRNQHSGTIPTVLGNMAKLQECWLHRNQFTGKIPSELGAMQDLLDLRLHFNPLNGTIPEEIYNIETLTRLDVYDCQLTGTISTSISKLSSLETFRIRGNRGITGTVPSEIGLLRSIKELWLHLTGLVGVMPDEVCAIRGPGNLEILEANCADTNGFEPPALDCECCTECCDAASEVCAVVGEA